MSSESFTIDKPPVPASRPRVAKNGAVFYPKGHATYKKFLDNLFGSEDREPVTGPCELRFMFVHAPYKTSSHPVHRSDVDNLSKLPMDSMTSSGCFYSDDDLVVALKSYKRFAREGEEPHTKVKVVPIGMDYADYVDQEFNA